MSTAKGRAGVRPRKPIAYFKTKRLASAITAALAFPAVGIQTGLAQEAEQQGQLEEVLVTGSRIVRRDFTANSPIQTVDSGAFEQQASISLESALNDLPQFVPA